MEHLGKADKHYYLAETMSDSYGSMSNKHTIPEKEESSFCGKGNSYPCWRCNYKVDFSSPFQEKFYCLKLLWHLLKETFYKLV